MVDPFKEPMISVVMPVYNAENYVAEAISSILNQTFSDFEFIIINDASTDNSLNVIKAFNDPRIKIIDNKVNQKVVKCLNAGFNLSIGKYIARMDADDISLSNRFATQLNYFEKHPDVDCCGSFVQVFGDKEFVLTPYEQHADIKAAMLFLNIMVHPSMMFRRDSFSSNGLFYDDKYVNAEDYGLWVIALNRIKFANVPEILVKYRLHDSNVSIVNFERNWTVIKEMNWMAYSQMFKDLGLYANEDTLQLHINLGFKHKHSLSDFRFSEYIRWLKEIVKANRKTTYFDEKALRNQILHNIIFLTKHLKPTFGDVYYLVITLTRLYSPKSYIEFLHYRFGHLQIISKRKHI